MFSKDRTQKRFGRILFPATHCRHAALFKFYPYLSPRRMRVHIFMYTGLDSENVHIYVYRERERDTFDCLLVIQF